VNSWKVILATMVIFGTGVVTGGLLVGLRVEHAPVPPRPFGPGGPRPMQQVSAGGMRDNLLRRVAKDLDLTSEQRDQVEIILKESQDRTRKVMSPFLREEMERTAKEFRGVLTTNQQARFDDLLKQKQQQLRVRGSRTNGPPGITNN
jgi:Spy/CpxP family protein refolding chaperone